MYLIKSKNGDRLHVTSHRERQLRETLRSAGVRDSLEDVLAKARRMDSPLFSRIRFSSRTDDGVYTLLTTPLKSNGRQVYTVLRAMPRPRASSELEVKDEVQAVVEWDSKTYSITKQSGRHVIEDARHPGVYIVERDGKPVYVGITWTGTIAARFRCRVDTFTQFKIPPETARRYSICVGAIRPKELWIGRAAKSRKGLKDLYESVERVLIRYLIKEKGVELTNRRSVKIFTVAKPGVSVNMKGRGKPNYLPAFLAGKAGSRWEIGTPARLHRHQWEHLVTR